MKRLALFALTVAVAACGSSSTGPTDKFTGNWYGLVDGDSVKISATQSGNTFTGNGIVFNFVGDTSTVTFNGTSTPPTLQSILAFVNSETSFAFTGTYISADSISGEAVSGSDSLPFALGRH
jgi:hypothetical protein